MAVRGITKQQATNTAIELLHKVHLFEKENSYPHQMSGGEQQRVAIARALIMQPKVLLFDEVTSALDPETVGEVLKVMMELAEEGMTMLIVSHEMGFVREAADRILFLSEGNILEQGSPQELLGNPRSSEAQRFLRRLK
jgi:polar amino acid transport system ATP-binding protein